MVIVAGQSELQWEMPVAYFTNKNIFESWNILLVVEFFGLELSALAQSRLAGGRVSQHILAASGAKAVGKMGHPRFVWG